MDLHGGFKKRSIWIGVETKMCLLPCWVYVCGVIVRISRLLRGGQANVGNIFEPSPNWLLNVQFTGQFGEGGSQVTAPSVGCNKYARLNTIFSHCPNILLAIAIRDRICRLQPVADLRDLVAVVPMLGTSRHRVIPWDHRIAMGLSHHDGTSYHHETSLIVLFYGYN